MKTIRLASTNGIQHLVHLEETLKNDELLVHTEEVQPAVIVDQILRENHEMRRDGFKDRGMFRPYARVPTTLMMKWQAAWAKAPGRHERFEDYVAALLEHSDNEVFLTSKYKQ